MISATLPTSNQVLGPGALGVLHRYGFAAGLSDLAVLLGGAMGHPDDRTRDGRRTGYTWTTSRDNDLAIECVDPRGKMIPYYPCKREFSVRPVLPPLTVEQILPTCRMTKGDNIPQFQWGEYPQTDCTAALGADAARAIRTDQSYTFDSIAPTDCEHLFAPVAHAVYRWNDCCFIRVMAQPDTDSKPTLGDGRPVTQNRPYLVRIEPVTWLWDEKTGYAISQTALLSGIPFDSRDTYNGQFLRTFMAHYMDQIFMPELTQSLDLGRFGPQDTVAAPNFEKLVTDLARDFCLGLTDIQLANMRRIIQTNLGGKYMQCFDDALLRANPRLADRFGRIKKYHTR